MAQVIGAVASAMAAIGVCWHASQGRLHGEGVTAFEI